MNVKQILILAILLPLSVTAQTKLSKMIPVSSSTQRINMHFDYPELVSVSTWDRNEISVEGTISINGGENDDAFLFEHDVNGNIIDLHATIRNLKDLPQRITVFTDGKKIMFRDKSEFRKYQEEHGKGYNTVSWGADIEVKLNIKVPKGMDTRIESTYGMVEVRDFSGPLTVEATYGGVDAALAEKSTGEITAETNYGEIYTNFDSKFGDGGYTKGDFHTFVSAKPGNGPRYSFESKYGNVYIRKAQ
jgi:hypothetical protein